MKSNRLVWLGSVITVGTAGCALVLGVDGGPYENVGAGGQSSSATTSSVGGSGGSMATSGPLGTLGQPCKNVGELACAGHVQKVKLICGPDMKWQSNGMCGAGEFCDAVASAFQGTCLPVASGCNDAMPGDVVCNGLERIRCGPDLVTKDTLETCPYLCTSAACTGMCVPTSKQCLGNLPQTCDATGQWQDDAACSADSPLCIQGTCSLPPSCQLGGPGAGNNCGSLNEGCCVSPLVPGGTFNRSYDAVTYTDAGNPATVSSFRLDRFEVTVGRFRQFVNAYPGSKPKAGAGAHPAIANSGWDPAWDANLPVNQAALVNEVKCYANWQTWTDVTGSNESLPMNCITWFDAFAFCAWDGGRLATEAEWNYAAAGGGDAQGQRVYPWSSPPTSSAIDATYAAYHCAADGNAGSCLPSDILNVGSRSPKGDGRWGQADLAGDMWEWNLDWYDVPYPNPCQDCADLGPAPAGAGRAMRGGSYDFAADNLLTSFRSGADATTLSINIGVRCARTP